MGIITQQQGSFLQIDNASVRETVQSTLDKLGLDFTLTSKARSVRRTLPDGSRSDGFRLYDTYHLGYEMQGPVGEHMRACLRIQDSSVPGMAFRLNLGVFRLICLNGCFGFGDTFATRVIHRSGPMAEGALRDLPQAIEFALQGLPALSAAAQDLAAIHVQDPALVVEQLQIPEGVRGRVLYLLERSAYRAEDRPSTAWGLYNLVNEVDRLMARKGSTSFLERDEGLAEQVVALATAQVAA
jgi:hypothetical protein